jgi:hypothetical protein
VDKLEDNSCDIVEMSLEEADASTRLKCSALSKSSVDELKTWVEDPHHVILGFESFATPWTTATAWHRLQDLAAASWIMSQRY